MTIITKTFKKRLSKNKIEINIVLRDIDRVIDRQILRQGETELSNSFIGLKDCKVYKIRVSGKPHSRLLVLYLLIGDIKMPFYIAKKSDKRLGGNISINNLQKEIVRSIDKSLIEFENNDYSEF